MNPLGYASLDAPLYTFPPPIKPARSLGAHICLVQPYFARVSSTSANTPDGDVICTGRIRIHLPTPHAGSCPLDYTSLFVNLHRIQKVKLLQTHADRPVPLLGRLYNAKLRPSPLVSNPTAREPLHVTSTAAAGQVVVTTTRIAVQQPPSQTAEQVAPASEPVRTPRVSTSAHRATLPEGLTMIEQPVPASVAAVIAQVTGYTAAPMDAPTTRVSPAPSPHHHHHHHHTSSHPRPSAETGASSTQQSSIMPQHHHHHYQQTPQQQMEQVQRTQQHMRYRVGRSGSAQLQPLPPATNGESMPGIGAAGLVAAAAAEAAAREVAASVRRVAAATTTTRMTHQRRSASPLSSISSSVSMSLPREASATPLSMALSSIRRSGTRGSSSTTAAVTGGGTATGFSRLARPTMRTSNRSSLGRSASRDPHQPFLHGVNNPEVGGDDAGAASTETMAALTETPNGLADTRMFLRPPQHSLRGDCNYASEELHAAVLLAGSPGTASTLYRSAAVTVRTTRGAAAAGEVSGDTVEGAGAASVERQRELQLQLQRALQRQRRLERLMFHDGDEENNTFTGASDNYDDDDGMSADGTEGRLSYHRCRSGTGWDDGLGEDAGDDEPLWRASTHTQTLSINQAAVLSAAQQQERQQVERVPSVHPHENVSLSRFRETVGVEGEEEGDGLSILADSVLDVPRGWGGRGGARGRSSTTSPSPQPDPAGMRWQHRRHDERNGGNGNDNLHQHQQRQSYQFRRAHPSGSVTATAAYHTPIDSLPDNDLAVPSSTSATVSRSAAMAPTSVYRNGSFSDADTDVETARILPTTAASLSVMSIMTATLSGPSSMSYTSLLLPQHAEMPRGATAVEKYDRNSGDILSPSPPSPIHAAPASRLSMPSTALMDIVRDTTAWKSDSVEQTAEAAAVAVVVPTVTDSIPSRRRFVASPSFSFSPLWEQRSLQIDEGSTSTFACTRQSMRGSTAEDDEKKSSDGDEVESRVQTRKDPAARRQSSPSPAQLQEEAIIMRRRRAASSWGAEKRSSEEGEDAAGKDAISSSDLPSLSMCADPTQRKSLAGDSLRAFDNADDRDSDAPMVRRTSPGVRVPSPKCTRLTTEDENDEDGGRGGSGNSIVDDGWVDRVAEERLRNHSSSCGADSNRDSPSSPSPQQQDNVELDRMDTAAADGRTDVLQATVPCSTTTVALSTTSTTAATVPSMVYLSDMLRLSFSRDHDEYSTNETSDEVTKDNATSAEEVNADLQTELRAATPQRSLYPPASRYFNHVDNLKNSTNSKGEHITGDLCEPYLPRASCFSKCTTATRERSGMATASISSSPPSPNRTALRHTASLLRDEDEKEEHENNENGSAERIQPSPLSALSPFSNRCRRSSGPGLKNASMPLTPTAVANRLALSVDERRLHTSTASTVAWSTTLMNQPTSTADPGNALAEWAPFAFSPHLSEDSVLMNTITTMSAADLQRASAQSTCSSTPLVFSTPAQTRLQSLLQASTWSPSTVNPTKFQEVSAAEGDAGSCIHGDTDMCTPRRCENVESTDAQSCSRPSTSMGCKGAMSSPVTPLQSNDESPRSLSVMSPPTMVPVVTPPPSFSASLPSSMPPPQSSPFRGSGSFLRVQPCWSSGCVNRGDERRPSDGFEADIQLLARMTRMTVGNDSEQTESLNLQSTIYSSPLKEKTDVHNQQQRPQQSAPSPTVSPIRHSTNSLNSFVAPATASGAAGPFDSPIGNGIGDEDRSGRLRSSSGLYGSVVASRRSWAPRKGRPERRGKQRRARASLFSKSRSRNSHNHNTHSPAFRSVDPYQQLRFTTETNSSSPSARPSRGEECSSNGVFLPPRRLILDSAITSVATHFIASATEGVNDSVERWSTAQSTPNPTFLSQPPPHQQQRQRQLRPSPPPYFEALTSQLSVTSQHAHSEQSEIDEGNGEGLRSPSLNYMHCPDVAAQLSRQRQRQSSQLMWSHPASMSPLPARTPSTRPSLSVDFLRAPKRGPRGDRRRSFTPSVRPLPSFSPTLNERGNPFPADKNGSSARQLSLSVSGDGSENQSWAGHAPPRRPRGANRAASFSLFRSPSASGTRLTWGTTATTSTSVSEARPAALSFSPVHSARQRSPRNSINFNSGRTTPLRVPRGRTSGLLINRIFSIPPPPSSSASTTTAGATKMSGATKPLSLADELRSFSSPIFGPPPPFSTADAAVTPPSLPAEAFLASPPRHSGLQRSSGGAFLAAPRNAEGGTNTTGSVGVAVPIPLPAALQTLLTRGSAEARGVNPAAVRAPSTEGAAGGSRTPLKTCSSEDRDDEPLPSMKTPQRRRGCSERLEVNAEYDTANSSPTRQASPQ